MLSERNSQTNFDPEEYILNVDDFFNDYIIQRRNLSPLKLF